jgi:LysM repeat protein
MNYLKKLALFLVMAGILFSGVLAADSLTHVVRKGETIYSISRAYNISADELMKANNITDPSTLQAGRRLVIPSSAAAPAVTPAPSANTQTQNLSDYRVVRGDTLYSIARANGITLQALLEINRFTNNHVLKIGDVIKIPAQPATNVASTPAASTNTASQVTPSSSGNGSASNVPSGVYAMRWPVTPRNITYMSGQMGVVVEGERLESVRSLTQGNVISAGPWRKFGRVVIVETTGGYFYMYGGCESLSVNVGDRITPGTEVGRLGINTVSEKPQLYFMVFRNDTPIDPAQAPRAGIPAASGNAKS